MSKYELWYSEAEYSGVLLPEAEGASARIKWSDAQVIWRNEVHEYASAWEECVTLLHWGRRQWRGSTESIGATGTIRLTRVAYRSKQGAERSFLIPGWLGRIPAPLPGTEVYLGLVDHLSSVQPDDFASLLGHIYVERPGRMNIDGGGLAVEGEGPRALMVVDLRSADRRERMFQEFEGHSRDPLVIRRFLEVRLDRDLSEWAIETVHFFRPAVP